MSVKSPSIAEWCNTMLTEPMAHWWKPATFAVLQMSVVTFPEKSQAAHSQAFNKAFNTTDLLFNSPVWLAVTMAEQTKKRLMEVRSKTTPEITDYYRHRCCERQWNENLWDYNFKSEGSFYFTYLQMLKVKPKWIH